MQLIVVKSESKQERAKELLSSVHSTFPKTVVGQRTGWDGQRMCFYYIPTEILIAN